LVIHFTAVSRARLMSTLFLAAVCAGTTAAAQGPRWEVEVYAGAVAARTASEGSQTLPPAGASIVTSNPLFPSREVPSWFFGDGAVLVSDVNEEFGGAAGIATLDPLFASVKGARSGVFGARLRRSLSPVTSLEFSVDVLGSATLAPDLEAGIDAARQSFRETFTEVLVSGPFTSLVVDAASGVTGTTRRREFAITAGFNTDIGTMGPLKPYLTFGGGILAGTGPVPSAELSGHYRFSILGQVPINETDRVRIDFERPLTFTAVAGGGLRHDLSEKWAFRIDVRAFIGPDSTEVRVTADPIVQRGSPAGVVESFTNPAIQFSNDPATGRRSSLSAPMLDNVSVFSGGIRTRTIVTFTIGRRF
jgi:hypothetical protein